LDRGGLGHAHPNPPAGLGDVGLLLYYLALGLAVACTLTFAWLLSSRFGLALNAIRDDEDKAEAMGSRPTPPSDGLGDRRRVPGVAGAIYAISCASSIHRRRPSPDRPSACG
jgi:hypothetical protein